MGFTAQQTLDYLQSLYEKKLATYPRTDSRYRTSDMAGSLPMLVNTTTKAMPFAEKMPIRCNSAQVIDDSKVSDHHVIIPTQGIRETDFSTLPAGELALLHLISARLRCAVGQPHAYAETSVAVQVVGDLGIIVPNFTDPVDWAAGYTAASLSVTVVKEQEHIRGRIKKKKSMEAFAGKALLNAFENVQKEKEGCCPVLYYQPVRPSKQKNSSE